MSTSRERSPSVVKWDMCWDEVESLLWTLLKFVEGQGFTEVYGIPRGGLIPAVWLSHKLDIPFLAYTGPKTWLHSGLLLVDDVVDTGHTRDQWGERNNMVTLIRKPWSPQVLFSAHETDKWVKFPWENK